MAQKDSSGDTTTLVEKNKGTSWSIEASPNPSGSEASVLRSVACNSTSMCTAVGGYYDSSRHLVDLGRGVERQLVDHRTTPNPSGSTENILVAEVSCISTGACSAVGGYVVNSGPEMTLAEEWNGSSWSVEAIPNPSGAQQSVLAAVACTTAGGCTAVGDFIDSSDAQIPLPRRGTAPRGPSRPPPYPSGAEGSALAGVSCSSAGRMHRRRQLHQNSSGIQTTLAEVWNGTSWSIQTTPGPSGGQLLTLSGVACTTANGCTAVGDYGTISGIYLTLVEVGPSP